MTVKEQRLYFKEELDELVIVLRELFNPQSRKGNSPHHKKDILHVNPFLRKVFAALGNADNWKHVLASPPGRIEVTLLPTAERDRRYFLTTPDKLLSFHLSRENRIFLDAPDKMLTLFVSLPRGCIHTDNPDKKLLWGAEMPNKFYFGESFDSRDRPLYHFIGSEYPYR